ncbi:DUF1326 domain-containing protein [Leptospira adleri]|uniref:DUF1326 domain-containing protein n=1 Tax=Leptospira adleri TaxID=2023186 RepID=A0A2M9YLD7_9LEPT|nr:DUF1326 domain-containing protein [Leptospira adleri]PJZ52368.1 hypothetical protein CH380_15840 [Leptospira adleri]PJZ60019.1 hypothetical protein CH376_20675 [Leptospira adleri]
MSQERRWFLEGDYFEHCSCESLCPCLLSSFKAEPTYGYCQSMLAFHIKEGECSGVKLNDLNVAMLVFTPGRMADVSWTTGLYIDERADEEQFDSLFRIFSGEMGGAPEYMKSLTTKFLGAKRVPIEYELKGDKTRELKIPNIADVRLDSIRGHRGRTVWFDNVAHVAQKIAPAITAKATVKDFEFDWENSGKNGFLGPFQWKG